MKISSIRRTLALILICSICSLLSNATEITIGDGSSSQYYVGPTNYYKYSYSQIIYPQSDINQEGLITNIALQNSSNYERTHFVEIYMGSKTSSTFTNSSDWVSVSNMQLVYSGNLTIPTSNDWYDILLDNPYYYYNTENLVIAYRIESTTNNYSSTSQFKYTNRSNSSLYYRSSGTNINATTPPSGSISNYGMNLKISITQFPEGTPAIPTLKAPLNNKTKLENHSLSWSMGLAYPPQGYYLSLGTNTEATDILNSADIGLTTTYNPTLEDGTTYYWKVKAYNSFGESAWSPIYNFTTFNGCEIGNASATTYHLPFYTYYVDNTYSQCLYKQADINKSGIITSLYLHHSSTKIMDWNNIEIFMGTKTESSFTSTSDWVPSENLQLVFAGNIHFDISTGYLEIPLDNPFYYNNNSNLVIAYHSTESIRNTTSCYNNITSTSVSNSVLIKYGSTTIDISNPGTANTNYRNELPDIKLAITEISPGPPAKPILTNPLNNQTDIWGINLSWSMGLAYPPDGYKLYFGTNNPPTNISNGIDLGNTTTHSPDLNFATTYYWQIEAYNSYGISEKSDLYSFTTFNFSPAISNSSICTSPADSSISLTGTGFDPIIANNTVLFGGVPGTITNVNENSITAEIPKNATSGYIWLNTNNRTHIFSSPFYPQIGTQEINSYLFNNEETIATNVDGGSYANVNIEVADFNLDGFADIAAIDDSECIRIFKNNGAEYSLSYTEQNNLIFSNIEDFTLGDFNSDGLIDLAAMNSSYQINVYINQSNAETISFASAQTFQPSGLEYGPGALTACDLNYDNMCDIFIAGWNEYVVMENTYSPGSKTTITFNIGADIYEGIGGTYKDVDFGDIDNDGDMDIIAQMNNGGSTHKSVYFQNQTTPGQNITIGPMTLISTASGYTQSLTLGDIDQDGLIDIILSNGDDVDIIRNNNTTPGTVSLETPITINNTGTNTYYTYQTKLADINADGYPEIIHSNGSIFVIENKSSSGTLNFGSSQLVTNSAKDFVITDANNDGYFDIVYNKTGSDLAMLKSTLPPTVTTSNPIIFGSKATLGGEVLNDGTLTVTERGIVYNTTGAPTTNDTKINIGSGLGTFSEPTNGYSLETIYYVRAYAINAAGTGYGETKAFSVDALLPVELINFDAKQGKDTVLTSWSTASESNTESFSLYLSKDMTHWDKHSEIKASGFSNIILDYKHAIYNPNEKYKYVKLTEKDFDNSEYTLGIRSIKTTETNKDIVFLLFPNPCKNTLHFTLYNHNSTDIEINIYDLTGKLFLKKKYTISDKIEEQIKTDNLPPGIYIVKLHTNQKIISKKITKY